MLGVLAVLVAVTWLSRRTVCHPILSRLRVLLPAWRFFDRAAPSPYLLVRWAMPGASPGAWSPIDRAPREPLRWAFAPRANLLLAYHAAIEQLVAELGELALAEPAEPDAIEADPAIVNRVSYALVSRIAGAQLPDRVRGLPGAVFQWKLVVPGEVPDEVDSLVSVELAA